jgi:hypothetical protein
MAAEAVLFVQSVHPVTGEKTPQDALPSVTIRFRNPDKSILAVRTLVDGVVNHGGGYYYANAVPTKEGIHYLEFETGGAKPGRDKTTFTVEPF